MKKLTLSVVSFLIFGAAALTACGGTEEKIETTKTQLYIKNYNTGFGDLWLQELATRFEEANKDISFEPGKVGVQCRLHQDQDSLNTVDDFLALPDDIIIWENLPYYMLSGNGDEAMLDITDVMTTINPYEPGKTIESKLSNQQKTALKVNGKYYGIPSYSGSYGIVYNTKLFEDKYAYFAENGIDFIEDISDKRSAGPDGEFGTYDDGLPVTNNDLLKVCRQLKANQAIPYIVSGKYNDQYFNTPLINYAATADGFDAFNTRYSFDGSAPMDVYKVDGQGNVITPHQIEQVRITANNPEDVFRSVGLYNGIDLVNKLVSTDNGGYTADPELYSFNSNKSHLDAEDCFINGIDGKQIGMLFDGNWWFSEARETLKDKDIDDCTYGWMPLPRLEGQTETNYVDQSWAYTFIKRTIDPAKVELAKKFLYFRYTDASMKAFTKITSSYIGLDYTYTEDEINSLPNEYIKNLIQFRQSKHSHIVYALNNNNTFKKNESKLRPFYTYLQYKDASGDILTPSKFFYNNNKYGKTTDDFFSSLYKYSKKTWSN